MIACRALLLTPLCQRDRDCPVDHCCLSSARRLGRCAPMLQAGDTCLATAGESNFATGRLVCPCAGGLRCKRLLNYGIGKCTLGKQNGLDRQYDFGRYL
ncbi:hypothetical protein NP493_249g07007 [Ridgeia piscesae]|uniref:Prokineticin domain-containing protein n=1 Tax=Ridgeia piscesae TaxID=27915 RepID=A0AAD9NYR2_RIDPI|nr:hypothetical protein NP493_249g07007 [Ridgeia piscesae]